MIKIKDALALIVGILTVIIAFTTSIIGFCLLWQILKTINPPEVCWVLYWFYISGSLLGLVFAVVQGIIQGTK